MKGMSSIKILSWNVNGLRARLKAGFAEAMKEIDADIICIQETRAKQDQLPATLLGYHKGYYSVHTKAGYAGATTFVRRGMEPLLHVDDFPTGNEPGRVSICDFRRFKLINAYVPNSGMRLEKLDARLGWQSQLESYIKDQFKPVILCGDLNVAPELIDIGAKNVKAGTSLAERNAFKDITNIGMFDAYRMVHPEKIQYTWFSYYGNARESNKGLRLDTFVLSDELRSELVSCDVITEPHLICGSDHLPVLMEINLEVE